MDEPEEPIRSGRGASDEEADAVWPGEDRRVEEVIVEYKKNA